MTRWTDNVFVEQVSYSLLVFFSGMFITVDGFNKTGIPAALWSAMEPHARINNARGVAVLTSLIVFLSNVASNVPTGKLSICSIIVLLYDLPNS